MSAVRTSTGARAAADRTRSRGDNGPRRCEWAVHTPWPAVRGAGDRDSARQRLDRDDGQYTGPLFGGPAQVLKYLARYTHRVAISNSRLLVLSDGRVTFCYKDYADAHRHKTMTLEADEFLRRFVQHVLPRSFVKIRHYGLLANGQREVRLAACRRLLLVTNVTAAMPSTDAAPIEPAQPRCCPQCGGSRLVYRALQPGEVAPTAPAQDSS
jgi:hypothetical protein